MLQAGILQLALQASSVYKQSGSRVKAKSLNDFIAGMTQLDLSLVCFVQSSLSKHE